MYPFFLKLSRVMAYLGGLMLVFLVILTCLSIAGRSMNSILHSELLQATVPTLANGLLALGVGPINGDFEVVEAGMAFSIFAFLPLCQITGGHASVDIFTSRMSKRVNRGLLWITDLLFAIVLIIIAVQLGAGMLSKLRSGQTTFLLEFPVWWAYALSLIGSVIAAAVSIFISVSRTAEFLTGHTYLPPDLEAGR